MEGFVPSEVARILSLSDAFVPVVLLAIGPDPTVDSGCGPRFRFSSEDLVGSVDE
jgi:hypothetical protein